ncbi:hypothetical protein EMCRGX_G028837 [Ephydatia muelleri]
MVEDFNEGDFQKYISNSGWVKPRCFSEYSSMPAFAHWSWVHTGGSLMVSDLQGVRCDSKYVLTDPAILSLEGSYGSTDLSLVGMGLFFLSHQCTDVCRSNGNKRPDMSQIYCFMNSEFGRLVQMATTYFPKEKFESLPPQMKQTIRDLSKPLVPQASRSMQPTLMATTYSAKVTPSHPRQWVASRGAPSRCPSLREVAVLTYKTCCACIVGGLLMQLLPALGAPPCWSLPSSVAPLMVSVEESTPVLPPAGSSNSTSADLCCSSWFILLGAIHIFVDQLLLLLLLLDTNSYSYFYF